MCGRYVSPAEADIERYWELDRRSNPFAPRFNVAPTTLVPIIVRGENGGLELHSARWGLIPHWWKKDKPPTLTFNARSEEAAVKPTWRDAYKKWHCLMPAAGWYEWQEHGTDARGKPLKTPYFVHCEASPIIAFAGLVASWTAPDGQLIASCALLSKVAAPSIEFVHDRMPVVLPPTSFDAWLSPGPVNVTSDLIAHAREDFIAYPVSNQVNSTRNDSPDLLNRVDVAG